MSRRPLWILAKLLEAVGLLIVLVGVSLSIGLGFEDEGLKSMSQEFQGLLWGGALFLIGYLIERAARVMRRSARHRITRGAPRP